MQHCESEISAHLISSQGTHFKTQRGILFQTEFLYSALSTMPPHTVSRYARVPKDSTCWLAMAVPQVDAAYSVWYESHWPAKLIEFNSDYFLLLAKYLTLPQRMWVWLGGLLSRGCFVTAKC